MSATPERSPCPSCGGNIPARLGVCARCLSTEDSEGLFAGMLLEEEIGRGGMGRVFRARQVALERTVAVKFMAEELAHEPEFRARFEREARALAKLSHPNIVAVHDFGEADGQLFLVLEYVSGKPLSAALPLNPREALRVASGVCAALEAAHAQGIVHRDIKPANVLLDVDGAVKVTDFGIARLLLPESTPRVTRSGLVLATPHYSAPEVLLGASPDPRQDVFSVGVLLHELITGRLPTAGVEPLPFGLSPIVRRALAADPQGRYPSIAALTAELARAGALDERAELPEDEVLWVRAVALLHSTAAALGFWALLTSLTPRVVTEAELAPLIMLAPEALGGGRFVTRARFDPAAWIAAVAVFAIALGATALLRRHWRREGLDLPRPELPLGKGRFLLGLGTGSMILWGLRKLLEPTIPEVARFIPVLGGAVGLYVLFHLCAAILEALRRRRSLLRERALWLGFAFCLVPPVIEYFAYVTTWKP